MTRVCVCCVPAATWSPPADPFRLGPQHLPHPTFRPNRPSPPAPFHVAAAPPTDSRSAYCPCRHRAQSSAPLPTARGGPQVRVNGPLLKFLRAPTSALLLPKLAILTVRLPPHHEASEGAAEGDAKQPLEILPLMQRSEGRAGRGAQRTRSACATNARGPSELPGRGGVRGEGSSFPSQARRYATRGQETRTLV